MCRATPWVCELTIFASAASLVMRPHGCPMGFPHEYIAVDPKGRITMLGDDPEADFSQAEISHAVLYLVTSWPYRGENGLLETFLTSYGRKIEVWPHQDYSAGAVRLTPELERDIRRVYVDETTAAGRAWWPISDNAALVSTGVAAHTQIWWGGLAQTLSTLLAIVLLPVSLIFGIPMNRKRRREIERACRLLCAACGYSRAGLVEGSPCPECGTAPAMPG